MFYNGLNAGEVAGSFSEKHIQQFHDDGHTTDHERSVLMCAIQLKRVMRDAESLGFTVETNTMGLHVLKNDKRVIEKEPGYYLVEVVNGMYYFGNIPTVYTQKEANQIANDFQDKYSKSLNVKEA